MAYVDNFLIHSWSYSILFSFFPCKLQIHDLPFDNLYIYLIILNLSQESNYHVADSSVLAAGSCPHSAACEPP